MSDKWMRAAGLLVTNVNRPTSSSSASSASASGAKTTNTTFTSTETGIEFKKVAKSQKSISKKDYDVFLTFLVKRKLAPNSSGGDKEVEDLKSKVKSSLALAPKPQTRVSCTSDDVVSRLTDHTKYTGSHKHRFDAETGKGRGKEGRV